MTSNKKPAYSKIIINDRQLFCRRCSCDNFHIIAYKKCAVRYKCEDCGTELLLEKLMSSSMDYVLDTFKLIPKKRNRNEELIR